MAISSKSFVEGVFSRNQERFGQKRRDGARAIVGAETELGSLWALRVRAVE